MHDLLWEQDSAGFLKRMEKFLQLAEKHQIGVMFVLFDSVWDPLPKLGQQRAPKQGLHNSGWVQSPGAAILQDQTQHEKLKRYVQGVVGHFKNDKRIDAWDVWNEPDNLNGGSYGQQEPKNKVELMLPLLKKTFDWAREMQPTQPLTSGVWIGQWADASKLNPTEQVQLENSDVISFHCYGKPEELQNCMKNLTRYERPILCTEYMARPNGSTFDPHLQLMHDAKVGAYCWGFVNGKSNTIYPWDSWKKAYDAEPPVWFHDIFRADGTPYREEEVQYIRKVTGKDQVKK